MDYLDHLHSRKLVKLFSSRMKLYIKYQLTPVAHLEHLC